MRVQPAPGAAKTLQAEIRERHVGLNRHHLHHAFALTVLRHQRQPLFQALLKARFANAFAVKMHLAALTGHQADQAFKQLGAPGAQQAVNTDHFAFAEGEGDVIELVTAAGMQRGQPFDVKHCVAFWRRLIIKVFFLITDHLLDDPRYAGVADVTLADKATVAENGDVVANLHQLFEAMRDIDDGHAAALKLRDHLEQHFDLRLAQRRGGLVHDQHAGVFRQGAGNLD